MNELMNFFLRFFLFTFVSLFLYRNQKERKKLLAGTPRSVIPACQKSSNFCLCWMSKLTFLLKLLFQFFHQYLSWQLFHLERNFWQEIRIFFVSDLRHTESAKNAKISYRTPSPNSQLSKTANLAFCIEVFYMIDSSVRQETALYSSVLFEREVIYSISSFDVLIMQNL